MSYGVLFVCTGNICRSPSAEAIFRGKVELLGSELSFFCDSAGTVAYFEGGKADARMREFAGRRGYNLESVSRKFDRDLDFDEFDLIVGMDQSHISELKAQARTDDDRDKIVLMTDYCTKLNDTFVPDPYAGGDAGFEHVMDILEDACEGLLRDLLP